jgi:hypothetical protein
MPPVNLNRREHEGRGSEELVERGMGLLIL